MSRRCSIFLYPLLAGALLLAGCQLAPIETPAPTGTVVPTATAAPSAANVVRYTFNVLNMHRGVVLVDKRGTGRSNRLFCPEMDPEEAPETYAERCLAETPGDPRFYTTAFGMDDLDDVRWALGYEQINLYGISYGVTALQVYLNRHGEHLRSAVLDRGTLLDVPFQDVLAVASQQALETVFSRCTADSDCSAAFPDLPGDFQAAMDALEGLTEPLETGVTNPADGNPILINRNEFNDVVHNLLLYTGVTARLPYVIHQAAEGNWGPAAQALAEQHGRSAAPPESQLRLQPVLDDADHRLRHRGQRGRAGFELRGGIRAPAFPNKVRFGASISESNGSLPIR